MEDPLLQKKIEEYRNYDEAEDIKNQIPKGQEILDKLKEGYKIKAQNEKEKLEEKNKKFEQKIQDCIKDAKKTYENVIKKLEEGNKLIWTWEMYNLNVPVEVKTIKSNEKLTSFA